MRKSKGPWTVLKSKKLYENPWIRVHEDNVIRPDGKSGIFGVVIMKPGVTVLPFDDEGNVYLTEEYHYAVERLTVEGISGGIDAGETQLQAAKRELQEEAGFIASKWTYLGVVDPFTSVVYSPNFMYLAHNLKVAKTALEGTETMKIIKLPFEKVVSWALQSRITHAATVAVILKAKLLSQGSKK